MGNVVAPSGLTPRLREPLRVLEPRFPKAGLPPNPLDACESAANSARTPRTYTWTLFMGQVEIQTFGFCSPYGV